MASRTSSRTACNRSRTRPFHQLSAFTTGLDSRTRGRVSAGFQHFIDLIVLAGIGLAGSTSEARMAREDGADNPNRFSAMATRARQRFPNAVAKAPEQIGGILLGVILHVQLDVFLNSNRYETHFFPHDFKASFLIICTLRLSSPGLSTGVSQMNGMFFSFGCRTMRVKASAPICPLPMCSWRSAWEPKAVLESLA